MLALTLATKVYRKSQLNQINDILRSKLHGLDIKTGSIETDSRGWVKVAISGEDEKIALNYLAGEFGSCITNLRDIEKYSVLKGYVEDAAKETLYMDVGVSTPKSMDASVQLQRLQAQLVDGRKAALVKIASLFGLITNLPLTIKILSAEADRFEAELDGKQINQYTNWVESKLDRLIIVGTGRAEVESTLERAHLKRDVANIEDMGMLEHSIVCKLGTDAVGLIPKMGFRLRHATFAVFSPKRISEFLRANDNPLN